MNFEETEKLCRMIAGIVPSQKFDDETPMLWQVLLDDIRIQDAVTVLRDLGKRARYIAPVDIIDGVEALRQARRDAHGPITPPRHLADNPKAEIEWIRAAREAISSGQQIPAEEPRAIGSAPSPAQVLAMTESVAESKRLKRSDTPPLPPPASPTVDQVSAQRMEAERQRQIEALAQIDEQAS